MRTVRLAKLPKADPKKVEEISPDEAAKTILGSDYHTSDVKVESVEPLGMKEGTRVSVETLEYVEHRIWGGSSDSIAQRHTRNESATWKARRHK